MSLPTFRVALLGVAGATLLAGVVVCSSDTAEPATSAAPSSSSTVTDTHEAFAQCLTDHGLPAPPKDGPGGPPPHGAPPGPPPGVDEQTWDSARQACASLAPAPPAR